MSAPELSDSNIDPNKTERINIRLRETNWLFAKEVLGIVLIIALILFFCSSLWVLMDSLRTLIDRISYFPPKQSIKFDWHIIFLATALVAAPTVLAVALLRSLFPKASQDDSNIGPLGKLADLLEQKEGL